MTTTSSTLEKENNMLKKNDNFNWHLTCIIIVKIVQSQPSRQRPE